MVYYLFIIDYQRIIFVLLYFFSTLLFDFIYRNVYLNFEIITFYLLNYAWNYISLISFLFICLANPGIIDDKEYSEVKMKEKYKILRRFKSCKKCNIIVPETINFEHCQNCRRCIINPSHHSMIFDKCIGKYNFFNFIICLMSQILIISRIIIYIFHYK